jgi:hypothetical protein
VLLFARAPECEARAKKLPGAAPVFRLSLQRLRCAAAAAGAELVVAGECWSGRRTPPGTPLLPQRGGAFGERLSNAFADVFALGYSHVVSVGIDTPGLRAAHLAEAFAALVCSPAVLGPSPDGGVYLIGLAGPPPAAFPAVAWLTPRVLVELTRALPAATVLVRTVDDLDSAAALPRLVAGIGGDEPLLRLLYPLAEPPQPPPPRWTRRVCPRPSSPRTPRAPPRGPQPV